MSAVAGLALVARTSSGVPHVGAGWELDSIAAIVIGGTRLFGGEGNILKAMLGVIIYQTVANIMNLVSLNPFYQDIVKGRGHRHRRRRQRHARGQASGRAVMSALIEVAGTRLRSPRFWQENGTLAVLLAFVILATLLSEGVFIRPSNLITILYQASIVGVLVLGQSLVVIAGGMDLSIVAVLILSATVMGGAGSEQQSMMMLGGLPYIGLWPAVAAGFLTAAFFGLVNGLMVTALGIPAFIGTLATTLLVGGIILVVTGGSPIYYPDPFFTNFGNAKLFDLPAPVYVFFGLAAAVWWLLNHTSFGRKLYAVGRQ